MSALREIDTRLFVGGPADGRRHLLPPNMTVTEVEPKKAATVASFKKVPVRETLDRHLYRRETIRTPNLLLSFWRSDDTSLDTAILALFERYPEEKAP